VILRIGKIAAFFILLVLVVVTSAYLTLTLIIKSEDTVVVPDLNGKDVVYALEILTDLGLNTKVKGSEYSAGAPKNQIIFQEPEPGAEIKKGRDVRIILSKGARTILMPNLKGLSVQQARIILEENDLCQGEVSRTFSKKAERDDVMAQVPTPGALITRGRCVDLLLSMGIRTPTYMMPDLVGLSLDEAIQLLEARNLILGEIKSFFHENKPQNTIAHQEPLSGYRVAEASVVNIVINRKPDEKNRESSTNTNGIGLFRYRLENGFIKRRVRVRLNSFGFSSDLFDDYVKPGEEIWLLIPRNNDSTVLLYVDSELIKTEHYY
jgi:eukaryotic-like serine/threonine-protein kinase